jgi:hypothetical protein
VRIKWLALAAAAYLAYMFMITGWGTRAAIVAALANYSLFFGEHLWGLVRSRQVQVRQAARREAMRATSSGSAAPPAESGKRACAICGAREEDGADIRVCSCEKCGGRPGRTLCLSHARNH